MLPTAIASAAIALHQLPSFLQISRGKLKLAPLGPIAQLSEVQKSSFLLTKGVEWVQGKSRPMITFDPGHLDDRSGSYMYVVGSVLGGEKGWMSIEANKHDFLLLSLNHNLKKGKTTKYLVTVYGRSEAPLSLEVSGGTPTELKEGNFSAPMVIDATSNTHEAVLTVEDPNSKGSPTTNFIRVQRVTVELISP